MLPYDRIIEHDIHGSVHHGSTLRTDMQIRRISYSMDVSPEMRDYLYVISCWHSVRFPWIVISASCHAHGPPSQDNFGAEMFLHPCLQMPQQTLFKKKNYQIK